MDTLKQTDTINFPTPVTSSRLSLSQQQAILDIQHTILQMVASDQPEPDVFAKLCLMAEELLPKSLATIMLKQPNGTMNIACAPSVPIDSQQLLNGLKPGPTAGSCGNAVYENKPTFVFDALTDERCLQTCDVFAQFGLHACWSTPIKNTRGEAIGSFALSSFEIKEPGPFHKDLLAIGSCIIGILLERSQQQKELEFMAYNDALTGLANRTNLFLQLEQAIKSAREINTSFGVIFIDLNRFKNINDTFGHAVGDDVLKTISARFQHHLKNSHEMARVGGDEFVILVNKIDQIYQIADSIIDALKDPIQHRHHNLQVDCSLGVALYPNDGCDAETLLKNADTAMYHGKNNGIPICFYQPEFGNKAKLEFVIENQLRNALKQEAFELAFQAQVDTQSHVKTGFEVLLRCQTEDGNNISPEDFIPVAEKTGLIIPIGAWVVKAALSQAEQLQKKLRTTFKLSINLSAAQLVENHIDVLLALVNNSSFPNEKIYFEITETVLVDEAGHTSSLLEKIRATGIKLAIDDFGIGYSSLIYLKRLNVSQLKIDRMLINDINNNENDLAISKAVIALGRSLGLEVVAEGVETLDQATTLQQLGCHTLQGFYFSKPTLFKNLIAQ